MLRKRNERVFTEQRLSFWSDVENYILFRVVYSPFFSNSFTLTCRFAETYYECPYFFRDLIFFIHRL